MLTLFFALAVSKNGNFWRPALKRDQGDFQIFPALPIFSTKMLTSPATPICPKYATNRPATGAKAGFSA
jgi:hypothetical protein